MINLQNIDNDENSRRRTIVTSLRNIQTMVIEGYEVYGNVHDIENILRTKKSPNLELVLQKMPVSWISSPQEELSYDDYIDQSSRKFSFESQEK